MPRSAKKSLRIRVPSVSDVTDIHIGGCGVSLCGIVSSWCSRMRDESRLEYERMIKKYGSEDAYLRSLWNKAYGFDDTDGTLPFWCSDDGELDAWERLATSVDDDDVYYDDDAEEFWKSRERSRKKHSSKVSRARVSDDDDYMDDWYGKPEEDDEDDVPTRKIYFYTDCFDETSSILFGTVNQFTLWCDENCYDIPDSIWNELLYNNEVHCAVYHGKMYLRYTYEDLYDACSEIEYMLLNK